MAKVGFAVFGMGRMGLIHTKNLMMSGRASVKWLVRNDVKSSQQFIDTYNLSARCTSPDTLQPVLDDSSVTAVIISSPSTEHADQIEACIKAGKAVFCEKPVTPDIASTKRCYDLAAHNNVPLFCAFHRRFDPSFREMRDNIRSGRFGRLRLLKGSSHDPSPPSLEYARQSGGIFVDSTIHDLDMSLWMVGSRPLSVYACGNAFDTDLEAVGDLDLVNVTVKYEDGTVSMIDNGRKSGGGYDQRLEAKCEDGHLMVTNQYSTNLLTSSQAPPIDENFTTRYMQAYYNEMEHFLDVMQERGELSVRREDTLMAMLLSQACRQSVRLQTPVAIKDMSQ